jgi:hypothetical protein
VIPQQPLPINAKRNHHGFERSGKTMVYAGIAVETTDFEDL